MRIRDPVSNEVRVVGYVDPLSVCNTQGIDAGLSPRNKTSGSRFGMADVSMDHTATIASVEILAGWLAG